MRVILNKVRNKAAGRVGEYVLQYDRGTGRYLDPALSLTGD